MDKKYFELKVTKDEAESITCFFEDDFIGMLKESDGIDNVNWLYNMMSIYGKFKEIAKQEEE